ncbi:MAG: tetratricopeptide repeat protein [Treponema sp.]|nr:MAG: tetratricopeptide repeat protein [Treponema sp.]
MSFGIFYLIFASVLLVSCKEDDNAFLYDNLGELKHSQKQLVELLRYEDKLATRFSLINAIAENLQRKNKTKVLISFLTTYVEKNPGDVYNAYWLLMVANEYMQTGMPEVAAYYLERVITFYPDMTVQDKSIHYLSLQNLIRITSDPAKLVDYYSRLLNTLYDKVDPAYVYFMLAQAYEKLGEWDSAIQTYAEFVRLRQYDIIIPGIPDSYNYAKKIVDYANSSKNWTFETLDDLLRTVRVAIRNNDYATLERCKSKVNFFAMSWNQEVADVSTTIDFNFRSFMRGGYVKIAKSTDSSSTPYEAYLRTVGWSQYSNVWYLYFKKINFPADPEIHGRWEWAGIYYGEKQ